MIPHWVILRHLGVDPRPLEKGAGGGNGVDSGVVLGTGNQRGQVIRRVSGHGKSNSYEQGGVCSARDYEFYLGFCWGIGARIARAWQPQEI